MAKLTENKDNQLTIYSKYNPSLTGGIYNIYIQADIQGLVTSGYFTDPTRQTFEVRSAQFLLSPGDVHAVYPPPNSAAVYGRVIPHIILNKRVLPWERNLVDKDNSTPWLCLLTLSETELALPAGVSSPLETQTVQAFLTPEAGVLKPLIDQKTVAADVLASQCQSIKIAASTFLAVVPRVDELPYLAHVRQVNASSQAALDADDLGWFSVVTGNRLLLPGTAGQKYHIFLVSLEGLAGVLKPGATIKETAVKLCVLYDWSCVSEPQQGLSFTELVSNFVNQAGGKPENLLLRRYVTSPSDPDPAARQVLDRLAQGYMAVGHKTELGEETFAWFRGPFAPVIAQPLPRPTPNYHVPTASAAMIYDKTNGIFDHSYAAAWSVGRGLALADGTFGPSLLELRRKVYYIIGRLEDFLTDRKPSSSAELKQIVNGNMIQTAFTNLLAADIGKTLDTTFQNIKTAPPLTVPGRDAPSGDDVIARTRSFLQMKEVQDLLREELESELDPIVHWLAELQLFYKVPFCHLVPNPAMLPAESLRFFYIDPNWLDVLVDGALSLGVHSSKDILLNQTMKELINSAINQEVRSIRSQVLGLSTNQTVPAAPLRAASGLLIRSALVAGWPGLVIKGFKKGNALDILRMDKPAPGVLLCLFSDIPEQITLSEPDQGLYFGLEDGNRIGLRRTSAAVGESLQKKFPLSGDFTQFYRNKADSPGNGVLRINDGTGSLIPALAQVPELTKKIQPPDFTIQMIKAPEQLSFAAPALKL